MAKRKDPAPPMTDVVTSVPYDAADMARTQREYEELAAELKDTPLEIATDDDYAEAAELVREIAKVRRNVQAMSRQATSPISKALDAVRGWFKPALSALDTCERSVKGSIGAYQQTKAADADAARAEALAAANANRPDEMIRAAQAAADSAPAKAEGLSTRIVWTVESVDESALPREFMTADMGKIRRHAREAKDREPAPIQGVVFRRDTVVTAR